MSAMPRPARNRDLHGNAPDEARLALVLIDVINDLDFPGGAALRRPALAMARRLAVLKRRPRKFGIPAIYVNDNFGRWRSDFATLVARCRRPRFRGGNLAELLAPSADDYFVLKPKHSGQSLLHEQLGRVSPRRRLADPHRRGRQARRPPHGPRVRIYHFAGTEHALGVWPPTDRQLAAADPTGGVEHSQNLRNVINYGPLLRAALLNLDRWVVDGVEPPPSRHPRLGDGTAVPPDELRPFFDRIPGAHYPRRHALPRRLDFSVLPPRLGPALGSRVSAVDADGNEVAGLRLPEVAVPLASFTGWTLRHPDIGGEDQLLIFAGTTLPFARTRREREVRGDPRPAIEERYASREDYLARVLQAALALVVQRYLLDEDVDVSVTAAARLWDHFTAGEA